LKTIIDDLLRRLEALVATLKSKSHDPWGPEEVSEMKEAIKRAKKPLIPSRAIWERYTMLITLIDELLKLTSQPGHEYALYPSILVLKKRVMEFKETLEKAHVMERVQASIPVVLGFVTIVTRAFTAGIGGNTWVYLVVSSASLALVFFYPLIGLIGASALGCLLIALGPELGSTFTGILLLTISAVYVYLLLLAKSTKFESKMRDAIKGIDQALQAFTPKPASVDTVLSSLLGTHSLDDSGVLKYLDKSELLRYKAELLVALGLAPAVVASRDINSINNRDVG